ncbi:acetyl-CoA hydrolase/transferase family protein [Poseidonocella sp. HB161398]|uniref:acetyl-CoA hydrolase/transferase family protein n=1 Tax=Poseidonocella sp. HB161398 TaxID=2320855 RepID=UPI0014861504|nr:acetyl-CoA hydrolase/transferase C-terminal domain-containing protein [Poseidonocella sp. HB161398]
MAGQIPPRMAPETLDLARWIRPGDSLAWGQAAAEPEALTAALSAQAAALGPLTATIGYSLTETPDPALAGALRFRSYCGSGTNRRLERAGCLEILPVPYSALARVLDPVDVLFLHLPPAGPEGRHNLGLLHEYIAPLIARARCIIAEVNDRMPDVPGEATIGPEQIDVIVETSRPLRELRLPAPGAAERQIAAHVAGLVEDGSVLQMGLGQLPEAILAALSGHRDLGIHSGVIGDSVADLAEAGVITNARKATDRGLSVTGWLLGTRRLYDFAHRNPSLRLCASSYTHDPAVLAGHDRFVAVNSAVEVDLTGQINAETAGGRYIGSVGGAAEFLRGAHRSRGGLPVIALPATVAKTGASRIVAALSGPVSTPRSEAGIIVTEHGIADLRGRTLRERRRLMLEIAAPAHRAALAEADGMAARPL